MFKRLILGEHAWLFIAAAFATAAAIFLTMVWQALRMKRPQAERFADLPFNSDSAAARHDPSA